MDVFFEYTVEVCNWQGRYVTKEENGFIHNSFDMTSHYLLYNKEEKVTDCGGVMDKKILVVYGSKHGATQEISERIGKTLEKHNFQVDVMPANEAASLSDYGTVLIGSGVYIGQWVKEAVKFVQANEDVLKNMPVWIFSSGPTGEGDASELVQGWKLPRSIQECVDHIQPKGVVVFHGALDDNKLSWLERWMIGRVGAAKGDFRDWDVINQWAEDIAGQLK